MAYAQQNNIHFDGRYGGVGHVDKCLRLDLDC